MARILVTGGAGFVGSHLCGRLLKEGHKVACVDDLSTGSRSNIVSFQEDPNFHFIQHDIAVVSPILEWRLLEELFDGYDPNSPWLSGYIDQIYNLACPASPIHYQKDPIKTLQTNVFGVTRMLELADKHNAKILQASTSEVYGDPLNHPQHEGYWGNVNPIGPRSCYDEGKRCAETLFFDYHRHRGVNIRVARVFNTYGPNMHPDDGRVVSNFIVQALSGKPLTVYGDGSQTRSFCYVDDLVEGLILLMEYDTIGPVNLGNPREYTVRQLADVILELTGSHSCICPQPLPQDDPTRRKPDISLAKDVLGWGPKVNLDAGLKRTIGYFDGLTQSITEPWRPPGCGKSTSRGKELNGGSGEAKSMTFFETVLISISIVVGVAGLYTLRIWWRLTVNDWQAYCEQPVKVASTSPILLKEVFSELS